MIDSNAVVGTDLSPWAELNAIWKIFTDENIKPPNGISRYSTPIPVVELLARQLCKSNISNFDVDNSAELLLQLDKNITVLFRSSPILRDLVFWQTLGFDVTKKVVALLFSWHTFNTSFGELDIDKELLDNVEGLRLLLFHLVLASHNDPCVSHSVDSEHLLTGIRVSAWFTSVVLTGVVLTGVAGDTSVTGECGYC